MGGHGYSSRLVCLSVCNCESGHLDTTALRLQTG